MPPAPEFSAQLLGQTEKAANAILRRLLAEPGLTEQQWVTLVIAATSDDALKRGQLVDRVSAASKFDRDEADARIAELAAAQLLRLPDDGDEAPVALTNAGHELYTQTRVATAEITHRLWGDLPADDLATAARVLSAILARAHAELAST